MFGSDGRGCRSNGRLRRPGTAKRPNAPLTLLSATATATTTPLTHAPAGSPAAPRRPRRLNSTAGRRSRFRVRPADRPAISNHAPAVSPAAPDDSVVTSPTQAVGPGSGSSRRPIGSHSCCCLRRRPRCQPTFPGSRLVRRADAAPCVPPQQRTGTAVPHSQRRQHSRCEAPPSPHPVYQTWRYLT